MTPLYHASPIDIKGEIRPSALKVRDASEGPVVFATPSKALAATFGLGHDDSLANQGLIDGQAFVLIGDRQKYQAQDKRIHIYEIDPRSFTCDPGKGMGMHEYTSSQPARILASETHDSAIAAMRAYGVTLCFVAAQEYQELRRPENTDRLVERIRAQRRAEYYAAADYGYDRGLSATDLRDAIEQKLAEKVKEAAREITTSSTAEPRPVTAEELFGNVPPALQSSPRQKYVFSPELLDNAAAFTTAQRIANARNYKIRKHLPLTEKEDAQGLIANSFINQARTRRRTKARNPSAG